MIDYIDLTPPPAIYQYVEDEIDPLPTDYYPNKMSVEGGSRVSFDPIYKVTGTSLSSSHVYEYHIVDTGFTTFLYTKFDRPASIYMFTYQGDIDTEPVYRYYAVLWLVDLNAQISASGNAYYLYEYELPEGLSYSDNIYIEPVPGGSDIFWLYNFGSMLSSLGTNIDSILNFKIGGYNLLFILLSSGFTFYMGWCVVKWFIPL